MKTKYALICKNRQDEFVYGAPINSEKIAINIAKETADADYGTVIIYRLAPYKVVSKNKIKIKKAKNE